jgi:hypothetical protein
MYFNAFFGNLVVFPYNWLYNHPNQECLELKPAMVGGLSDPTA